MRVGYIHDWKSNWFNEREFADMLLEDLQIRDHIEGKLSHAGLSDGSNSRTYASIRLLNIRTMHSNRRHST